MVSSATNEWQGTNGPSSLFSLVSCVELVGRNKEPFQDQTHVDKATAARRSYDEARELAAKGSAASLRKALERYGEALRLFRVLADPHGEAATLNSIGSVYDDLGETQKALEYYKFFGS